RRRARAHVRSDDDRELSVMQELLLGVEDPRFACPDGSAPIARTCSESDDFTETTPRVIVDYELKDNVLIYGSWSKGYSSGGFNQDPGLGRYEPEISKNWELGMKSTFYDRRLRLNLNAYHNSYDNQQLSVARTIANQQVIVILNAQEATLYGFELELQALLGDWSITLSGGTTEGDYDKFEVQDVLLGPPPTFTETVVTRDLSDNELVRGSPYTASLGVGYTKGFSDGASLTFDVGYAYRGRQFNDIDTQDVLRQDAYGLLDARITWMLANGRTSFSLIGNNLTDKEYFSGAFGDTGSARKGFYWGTPRRVRLEFRHSLGG
ncbi:MAG: TonB-dependent receptor, partial [Gammaproteobacteria bacterium]